MSFEQTAARLAEVERDIRALTRMREELFTRLIDERTRLVAGLEHQSAEQPEATQRFRVPGFMGRTRRETGTSTVLLSSTGALSHLSAPAPCPETCCRPMPHQHYADGAVVQREESRRERSHRKGR